MNAHITESNNKQYSHGEIFCNSLLIYSKSSIMLVINPKLVEKSYHQDDWIIDTTYNNKPMYNNNYKLNPEMRNLKKENPEVRKVNTKNPVMEVK